MNYQQKALSYFDSGFNCSQAVFTVFATELGISEELALKMGTSFGGGARCGQICGAVAGALMVIGLKHGHYHLGDVEEKSKAYALAVDFNRRFCERNNSIVCRELLGYDLSIPEQLNIIKEQSLFQTICPKLISDATEIIEEMF